MELVLLETRLTGEDKELAKLAKYQEKALKLRYLEGLSRSKVAQKAHYRERHCKLFLCIRVILRTVNDRYVLIGRGS